MPPDATRPDLVRLDTRTRKGLSWVQQWARRQLTAHKQARKYRPQETAFEPQEAAILRALLDLENAASWLLSSTSPEGACPHRPGGVVQPSAK